MFSAQKNAAPASGKLFVEDVFSTWLYTGTGSAQTITNGIDLAGKGGMVWVKQRNSAQSHRLYDTSRGVSQMIASNTTTAQTSTAGFGVTSFSSSGFTLVDDGSNYGVNFSGNTYASWTFREAPNFFDVVTYTGTGSAQNIAHNLGAAVGYMMIKRTDASSNWATWHRALSGSQYMDMANPASAATSDSTIWNSTAPTSSVFSVGTSTNTNASGGTYVAYLWAHDPSSDGIIQCGNYTSTGNTTVTLGWEPQFIAMRRTNAAADWEVIDTMRGMSLTGLSYLEWNNSDAEAAISGTYLSPTATGFIDQFYGSGQSIIYIAIRRGPMRTPTTGTSVFSPVIWTGNATSPRTITGGGFPVDLSITYNRGTAGWDHLFVDRLRGAPKNTSTSYLLQANSTAQEITNQYGAIGALDIQDGVGLYTGSSTFDNANASGNTYLGHLFRRAPSFFDEVCYTGTTANRTISHNLGVVPELMIVKARNAGEDWFVYSASLLATEYLNLTSTSGKTGGAATTWNSTRPTASVFSVGTSYNTNGPYNYVAYLFASCPGVSKVGSYTGNGSSQTINCGFSAGARFVMIKRTDSTGNWLVADSARGIVAGNDPLLYLNSTAAEVTTLDWIDADASGFIVNQDTTANANANGATYIYLAIS